MSRIVESINRRGKMEMENQGGQKRHGDVMKLRVEGIVKGGGERRGDL